jgi:hypothetical protein
MSGVTFRLNVPGSNSAASSATPQVPKPAAIPAASSAPPPAAHPAAPTATCSHGAKCTGCKVCGKKKAPAKSAGGGDGGVSAQLSAMQSQLSSMHTKVDSLTKQVATGFTETKSMLTDQQQATLGMQKAMEALMMATAGFQSSVTGLLSGGSSAPRRELPAPPARLAICPGGGSNVTEVSEEQSRQYTHSCFASNEGGSASHSSQRSQIGAAFGGAQSFHREPVSSSTSMPKFEAAAARWNAKKSPNNAIILTAIRQFTSDDDMACMLLALVNGKILPEIVKMYSSEVGALLTVHNTSFFQKFFQNLVRCGLPPNFDVKVESSKTKSGHGFCMTYQQLSQAPGNVDKLVRILRGEE